MKPSFYKSWKMITVVVVVALVGAFSFGRRPGSSVPPASADDQAVVPSTDYGVEAMSSDIRTYGRVIHVDEAGFQQQVLQAEVPVLVDFYADWCGPCQTLAPTVEQLARELPHAKIVKVDVDRHPGLATRYGINSIPNLMVFKDGKITARHVGMIGKARLRAMLDQ